MSQHLKVYKLFLQIPINQWRERERERLRERERERERKRVRWGKEGETGR